MPLHIGNKVQFAYTLTEGKIVDKLDDGSFIVEIVEGLEIPAIREHLRKIGEKSFNTPTVNIPSIPTPSTKSIKGNGIQIAFEEQTGGSTNRYAIYLLNDTPYKGIFEIKIHAKGKIIKKETGVVNPTAAALIMEMPSDYLSDQPRLEVSCQQVSTEGKADWLHKELKIKPQSFFKKKKTAPIIQRTAFVYPLFEPLEIKKRIEDLRSYTQKNISNKPVLSKENEDYIKWGGHDVKRFANFPREKDLHIEKLVKDPSKMPSNEIMKKQIQVFNDYLDDAILTGVEYVFVIHGKGKGKLKEKIISIALKHPDVKTYDDSYHSKYGTGATKIIFNL